MNIFLLGGWVARPSAFYFALSPCPFPVFYVSRVLLRLTVFNLTALCQSLSIVRVPVLGMPNVSALLGYDSLFIHIILNTYSLDNIQFTYSPC